MTQTTLAFGHSRNDQGHPVVREGTIRREVQFMREDSLVPLCPCERSTRGGTAVMCWSCSGPEIIPVVDHTDGDL